HGRPLAWSGVMRADVDSLTAPISVTFNPFYITLNVARSNGARRAVASIVLQAAPPADRLTQSVEDRLAPAQGVASYSFAPPESVRAGPVVLVSDRAPVLRAMPHLATAEEIGFRRASMLRARGTIALVIGIPFASNIVRGIGQPPWGITAGLWLSWEIPLFLFLFAVLVASYWMIRMAFGRAGFVTFRAAVIIGSVSAAIALIGLWST